MSNTQTSNNASIVEESPLEALKAIEKSIVFLKGQPRKVRGVLVPKREEEKYSTFYLYAPDEVPAEGESKPQSPALQVYARPNEARELKEHVGQEVLIQGKTGFKLWTKSSEITVSLMEPKLLKIYGKASDIKADELTEGSSRGKSALIWIVFFLVAAWLVYKFGLSAG